MPKKMTQYPQKSRRGQEMWSLQDAKSPGAQERFMKEMEPDATKKGRPKKKGKV